MSDLDSIESLINPTDDEESAAGRFAKKQSEIKIKEVEAQIEERAQSLGLGYVNLSRFPISPEALSLIPEDMAREMKLVCFYYDGKSLRLACLEPDKPAKELARNLGEQYFTDAKLYLISEQSLKFALEAYKSLPKIKRTKGGVEISEASLEKFKEAIADYKSLDEKINEVNITDVVTLMLATAIKVGASDIHVEAEERGVAVRLRIDGVLQDAATISQEKWRQISSRLKVLSKVKINIDDRPQDGRYTIFLKNNRKIDVRCSFLPTAFGESVVMRLLDSGATALEFEALGIRPEIFPIIEKEIAKPNGLILSTGPTGSGKTTTLYAVLNRLNRPGNKIITLEDPIEYQLPGINQSQVDEDSGYSFSSGLRSALRQDPNIIMVGEIRDQETAEIAVQASLTGHLVLSTLHTNDAAGVIPRLIEVGVKPYFLAPSINAVIGQRLIRKLCPKCRQAKEMSEAEAEKVRKILAVISPKAGIDVPLELPPIYEAGPGCSECNNIGYKGRTGIYEIFTMDEKIKQLTVDQAPSFKILQQAIEDGMITMLQDGVLKALDGITSLEEVYRVVGDFDYVDDLYEIVISQTMGRGIKLSSAEMSQAESLSRDINAVSSSLEDSPTTELIARIMALGIASRAGDIHIEPAEADVKVRFRIDGVLHDVLSLPKTSYPPILSEVKIMAGAPTNVKRAAFDGRFSLHLPEKRIDCRVSIIAGSYGETIVVRLLSGAASSLDMTDLGLTEIVRHDLEAAMKKTHGIIITTGPTGSGKTTTLYSILSRLNRPDVKIITVEDPIEYQLPGIMQTQIDEERGYSFASAMRSLLRQNPNIMMIGEIRDQETAKIAIEAAMTGHLVLSTIHAGGAASAVSRFAGLGLERQALANAVEFAIGQRLVRRLCPHCKRPVELGEAETAMIRETLGKIHNPAFVMPEKWTAFAPQGCPECNSLGYKGRIGLYESITMIPEIQKLIQAPGVTDGEIEAAAISAGMVTMLQDGLLKVIAGETSLEEVQRAVQ